jgi:hypothetical protein
MRSPINIVGFIDPEGISFQSAIADLKDVPINRATKMLNPHPLRIFNNFTFHLFLILILLYRWLTITIPKKRVITIDDITQDIHII